MIIKIVNNKPIDGQEGITHLIGQTFQTLPYSTWDKETTTEMKQIGEVGIKLNNEREIYIINKDEYEVISE